MTTTTNDPLSESYRARRLWVHDDAAPDAESAAEAYRRLTGEEFRTEDVLTYADEGDARVYEMKNGHRVVFSFPGASCIYSPPRDGMGVIAAERVRQLRDEGWAPEHDDKHTGEELALAAACYALPRTIRDLQVLFERLWEHLWPFERRWWRPRYTDRVGELAKAGALIAAEIDRLQRAENRKEGRRA